MCRERIGVGHRFGGGHTFEERLTQVELYKQKHNNNTYIPETFTGHDNLGIWAKNQRSLYKLFLKGKSSGGMTQERVQALEDVGFDWGKSNFTFGERLTQVELYKQKHNNNTYIPKSFKGYNNLGKWANNQRYNYTKLYKSEKMEEHLNRLENVGFKWKKPN